MLWKRYNQLYYALSHVEERIRRRFAESYSLSVIFQKYQISLYFSYFNF